MTLSVLSANRENQKINLILAQLFKNKNAHVQFAESWLPDQIIEFLDTFDVSCNSLVWIDELWRYENITEIMINHPRLQNIDVFIATYGYQNKQLGPRTWAISWPSFFMYSLNSSNDFSIKPSDLDFGYNCLNFGTQTHRILLGYHLHRQGLLDQVMFTQNNQGPVNALIFDTLPDFVEYKNLLPILRPDPLDPKLGNIRDYGPFVYHHSYRDCYCNIVTETQTDGYPERMNFETITEKSYKPFIAKQIPIILASRGHIAYLKGLGFEMMEHLLPPGYDTMWTEQKVAAIVDVVSKGKDFIRDFYFDHIREINHNHELWFSGKINQTITQRVKHILN